MNTASTLKARLAHLDEHYLDPISEFFQQQTVKTGKRYVIKPLAHLMTEIVNTSVDAAFNIVDHFHQMNDSTREKIKDRKGRQRVKDGARELRAIIIEKALDVHNPIKVEDANEIYRRILFLNYVAQMLNMSDEVNLFPEEFEQIKLQIDDQKPQVLQLPCKSKEQTVGAIRYLADLFKV